MISKKRHENGRSAPCPPPHYIELFNILFRIYIMEWNFTYELLNDSYLYK